jgi:hypothetical protein
LLNREDFFNNTSYFDLTAIIVDTIIYYSDLNRIAAFIIIKNPSYRQLIPDKKYNWYYDGTCYVGEKLKDSLRLSWIGPSFSNSVNKEKLSAILKDYYFTEFAGNDTTVPNACKYNLNDVRFVNCIR